MLFVPKDIFCFIFCLFCFVGVDKTNCRKAKKYHRIRHSRVASLSSNDSLKLFQFEVCDRQKFQIKCPTHTKISIENAFYGNSEISKTVCGSTNSEKHKTKKKTHFLNDAHFEEAQCEFLNAPQKIMELCQNKEECGFKLKPNIFGFDSACTQKSPNFLRIWYKCRPSQFMSDYYCEDSTVELKCRNEQQNIAVYSAIYGRRSAANVAGCGQGSVTTDCTTDVLDRVMQMCHKQPACSFNVTNETLHVPTGLCQEDVKKNLNLVYICVDKNVFDRKTQSKDEIFFHKSWTPSKKFSKIETTTIDNLAESFEKIQNPMSDAAAFFPPVMENIFPRSNNNETNFDPTLADLRCSNDRWETEIRSCIPIYVPNFVQCVYSFFKTVFHVIGYKEQSSLYFCLSSSGGLILYLVFYIGYQIIFPKSNRRSSQIPPPPDNTPSTSVHRQVSFRQPCDLNIETLVDFDDLDDLTSSTYTYRTSSRANSTVNSVRPYQSFSVR